MLTSASFFLHVLKIFNDDILVACVAWHRLRGEVDHKLWVGRDFEGGGRSLFLMYYPSIRLDRNLENSPLHQPVFSNTIFYGGLTK